MKIRSSLCYMLTGIVFLAPALSRAQLWSGVLSPKRAVDWSKAGSQIQNRTTQCGPTIAAYSGSAATINNAIAACPAGQFVLLGAGTFNLSSGIQWHGMSNVTLRGQGANSTFLVFTGGGAGWYNSIVSMEPSSLNEGNDAEQNVCDWTAGYTQGGTTISLSNCGSSTPAAGSISNLRVGGILLLDQLDEYSDTGTIWNCTAGVSEGGPQCANNPVGSGGEPRHDGTCNSPECYRSQQQGVTVASCDGVSTAGHACSSGSNITISPGLYMPNWRSGQKPQAEFASGPITGDGLENVSIDATNSGSSQSILVGNCTGCYVSGVRSIDANRSHIRAMYSTHFTFQNNYTYENQSHQTVSYGLELMGGWDGVVANNIFQQNTDSEPSCSGACEGNVIAYNFNIDNVYVTPGWMQAGFYLHASGTAYNLWEGNVGPGYNADDVHGTHNFDTVFRNRLLGNENAGCGGPGQDTCTAQTTPIIAQAGARYMNFIGNVLGQTGYHTNYTCNATSTASCPDANAVHTIFVFGYTGNGGQQQSAVTGFCTSPSCGSTGAFDPQVGAYAMRWGNYDTVSGSNQFNSNEVPSGIASYSNPVPSSQSLPASMYLSTKPSWWQNEPWPAIGPDVASGNLGRCSGGTYSGELATSSGQCSGGSYMADVAGKANSTPALDCALNVMGMPRDGSGGLLSFNAQTCYGTPSNNPAPPSPSGLTGSVVPTN
ncbi:MAG TPA: hypothetical protein VGI45_29710 [Terracidiphilus sp.]